MEGWPLVAGLVDPIRPSSLSRLSGSLAVQGEAGRRLQHGGQLALAVQISPARKLASESRGSGWYVKTIDEDWAVDMYDTSVLVRPSRGKRFLAGRISPLRSGSILL